MKASTPFLVMILLLVLAQACAPDVGPDQVATGVAGTLTALSQPTSLATQPSKSDAALTPEPQATHPSKSDAALTTERVAGDPYPDAPLCPDSGESHDNSLFHTLWDSSRGCHYDHEHGQNPFTPEVAATFPGFDLRELIGGVGVGHTNPSSPMENTHKHGGFKWDVSLSQSGDCVGGEGAAVGVDAAVIQYHAFGDYSIEFESRTHSAMALMRQCLESAPMDYGYVFVNQLQDYGQRVVPYQGQVMAYPDTPNDPYPSGQKPYFTVECFGSLPPCDKYPTRQHLLDHNLSADSLWVSQPLHLVGSGSPLFGILFRVRDIYQILDGNDLIYPFTFRWLCSADDGLTYNPTDCRYNNTTTRVHQVAGEIPAAWDNMAGFDTEPQVGRITAEGYVTRFGELAAACTMPGPDCHPIKLVKAFVGTYGSLLYNKQEIASPVSQPERDIYFCGGQVCTEGEPSAAPSGWIGQNN